MYGTAQPCTAQNWRKNCDPGALWAILIEDVVTVYPAVGDKDSKPNVIHHLTSNQVAPPLACASLLTALERANTNHAASYVLQVMHKNESLEVPVAIWDENSDSCLARYELGSYSHMLFDQGAYRKGNKAATMHAVCPFPPEYRRPVGASWVGEASIFDYAAILREELLGVLNGSPAKYAVFKRVILVNAEGRGSWITIERGDGDVPWSVVPAPGLKLLYIEADQLLPAAAKWWLARASSTGAAIVCEDTDVHVAVFAYCSAIANGKRLTIPSCSSRSPWSARILPEKERPCR